ncbi:MAG: TrkH family potassium uptake protein [Halobacteria archaeon]|nr:TrkH family potassium uptake protein [Halobacteria archaeon]
MKLRVDWRASLSLVGTILKWLSVPLLIPLGIAVYYGEDLVPFFVTIIVTLVVGFGLEFLRKKEQRELGSREAFLMVSLVWFAIALVGAVPFVLADKGVLGQPVNALFESMSGITTTGATVIGDFGVHSRSVLMWRQVIQWIGGLGILVFAISILSQLSVAGAQLMETETQGIKKLTPRIVETARLLGKIYLLLTALQVVVLYTLHIAGLAPNMTLYNAVAHAFTTIATSGFSPEARSIEAFSPIVQWVIVPFMAVGATNFILLYYVLNGDLRRPFRSEEFRFYIAVLVSLSVIVAVLLFLDPGYTGNLEKTLRHSFFQVVSIVTTTGYANTDFNLWSSFAKHILFLGMFIGGMAGSTTCSIKTLRWLVVFKGFRRDLFRMIHPEVIRPLRLSGEVVDEETIRDIYSYTLLSIIIFFLTTIFIVVDAARIGLDITEFEAMGAAASTFLNIGPAFGIAGPFGSYDAFANTTKIFMVLLMWIGRIEILPILVLLTPAYWRS